MTLNETTTVLNQTLAIDANGIARLALTENMLGTLTFTASAVDEAGNEGTATPVELQVLDPSDQNPPTVTLTSPSIQQKITAPTDIYGIVTDDLETGLSWVLTTTPRDGGETKIISSGNGFIDGLLGRLDTTLLRNGVYDIDLKAVDIGGNVSTHGISIEVTGDLKLGNFTLSFVDLEVPVAGLPITITRTYDTLKSDSNGDFGYGWSLDVSNTKVDLQTVDGTDVGLFKYTPFVDGTRVVITLPDGTREGFTFYGKAGTVLNGKILDYVPSFIPDRGVTSELIVSGSSLRKETSTGEYYDFAKGTTYSPVDPQFGGAYTLILQSGIELVVNAETGDLSQIIDRNGNSLQYGDNEIIHDSGRGVTFERDYLGRITAIIDPSGNELHYRYDSNGDLVEFEDRVGNIVQFTYKDSEDFPHYLEEVINPDGVRGIRSEYGEDGRLKKQIQSNGAVIEYEYDLDSRTQVTTSPLGEKTSVEFDLEGNVLQNVNPLGGESSYEYDSKGRLTAMVDETGARTEYHFNEDGRLSSITTPHPSGSDPSLYTYYYNYNQYGDQTSTTYGTGAQRFFEYDENGNMIEERDGLGNVYVDYQYDDRGLITQESTIDGVVVDYEYDAYGSVSRATFSDGLDVFYTTNELGLFTELSIDDAIFHVNRDARGRILSRTDEEGNILASYEYGYQDDWTSITFDDGTVQRKILDETGQFVGWEGGVITESDLNGRRILSIDEYGNRTETTYEFDLENKLQIVTTTNVSTGKQTISKFDSAGRIVSQSSIGDDTTLYTYPDIGTQVITDYRNQEWTVITEPDKRTMIDPQGRATTTYYSPYGVPLYRVLPDGSTESTTYLSENSELDASDLLTSITDAGGATRYFNYDEEYRLTSSTDLSGAIYFYTHLEDDTTVELPGGGTIVFSEDELGQLLSLTYADSSVQTWTYDENGNLTGTVKPSGISQSYLYDENGLLKRQVYSTGEYTNFEYKDGTISQVTSTSGATYFSSDETGIFTNITLPGGGIINLNLNDDNRLEDVTAQLDSSSSEYTTQYSYDDYGFLTTVTDPFDGVTTLEYDDAGRLVKRTLPNGVTTEYAFNVRDQVTGIYYKDSSGVILASIQYTLDGFGQPTKILREDGSYWLYEYDAARRIVRETLYDVSDMLQKDIQYTYDANGNRTSKTIDGIQSDSSFASTFQLESVSTNGLPDTTYGYDADGRVTSITRDGITWTLEYDSSDLLIRVLDENSQVIVQFEYDGLGRRIGYSSEGQDRQLIATSELGGLNKPLLIADSSGNVIGSYTYLFDSPLARFDANGNPLYYLTDANGSIIGYADANGALQGSIVYDSFGNIIGGTGPAFILSSLLGGDFRFQGVWQDSSTDLQLMGVRAYDSETGLFLSRDSALPDFSMPETFHPYAFAFNNPQIYSDPTGAWSLIAVGVSTSISSNLDSAQAVVVQRIKREIKDQVLEFAFNQILSLVAGGSIFPPELQGLINDLQNYGQATRKAGSDFGDIMEDIICKIANGKSNLLDNALGNFWFAPQVLHKGVRNGANSLYTGDAVFEGFNCEAADSSGVSSIGKPKPPNNGFGTIFPGEFGEQADKDFRRLVRGRWSIPDFIIGPHTPTEANHQNYAPGDFKLFMSSIIQQYIGSLDKDNNFVEGKKYNQFKAIAGYSKRHGYRIAGFITGFKVNHRDFPSWLGRSGRKLTAGAMEEVLQIFAASHGIGIVILNAKDNMK